MSLCRDIDALHPGLSALCRELIARCRAAHGVELIVTSTVRTGAEQRAIHAQGRKALPVVNALRADAGLPPIAEAANRVVTHAPVSMHQFGLAFDVAVVRDGRAVWEPGAYKDAGRTGQSLGLAWGGAFRTPDYAHFEYAGGLTYADLKAGMRPAFNPPLIKEDAMTLTENTKKSGFRTSEFYLALIGAVLPVLNGTFGLNLPIEGLLSTAGVIVSYIFSRTAVKRA
jgi:hypothetical protein